MQKLPTNFFILANNFSKHLHMITVGYFFVVLGKLFVYSLGNFLLSHIEDNFPYLLPYKLWNWRSSVPSVQEVHK